MVEKTSQRKREPEPQENLYEQSMRIMNEALRQREEGRVVIHGKDLSFFQSRQAFGKFLLHRNDWPTVGTPGWHVFLNHIKVHTGKHRHQGGVAIYALAGKGYTIVDDQRYDWEAGDLLVLPIQPGGCVHQHFNEDPDVPAEWLVFIYFPMWEQAGMGLVQREEHPDWSKGKNR